VPKYEVDLKPVAGHAIPPLLKKFGAWLCSQEYGGVGWFSLHAETVPVEWDPNRIPRIQRDAFSFLHCRTDRYCCSSTPDMGYHQRSHYWDQKEIRILWRARSKSS
jgi:hypothetical protein